MKTLLKNARILKMDDTPIFISNIVVIDNKIAYIGEDYQRFSPFDIERDCLGNVLMPGFKNAHSHAGMSFLRSKADDMPLHDWLFNFIFPREAKFVPEDIYSLCKISFLEYLTSGITGCFDHYFYPAQTIKAAEEMGIRITVLCEPVSTYSSSPEAVVDSILHYRNIDGLVKFIPGLHAEYTSNPDTVSKANYIVHKASSPFFSHISETKSEVEGCYQNRGISPVKYFEENGLYDFGGGGFHCNYFDDKDIEIFKKHNCTIVTCPGSNTKLASGIAPIKKFLEAGVRVAIGTDGPASNNCLDMFKEMSLVYSLAKVSTGDASAIPAYEILKMATVNGAYAMLQENADILEVGKFADIIEIDLSRPNMQPLNNIVDNIVYSGSKDNIKMTMINGKILYADRKFLINQDIDEIYRKVNEIGARIDKEVA